MSHLNNLRNYSIFQSKQAYGQQFIFLSVYQLILKRKKALDLIKSVAKGESADPMGYQYWLNDWNEKNNYKPTKAKMYESIRVSSLIIRLRINFRSYLTRYSGFSISVNFVSFITISVTCLISGICNFDW